MFCTLPLRCPPYSKLPLPLPLPGTPLQAFEAKGVQTMYPWQAAALECGEALNNLVYCAPTSGGKSLVAEVLLIRRLLHSLRTIPQPRRSKPVSLAAGQDAHGNALALWRHTWLAWLPPLPC